MGNCMSSQDEAAAAKARSDEIDKQLDEDLRKFKKECKILLLGTWLVCRRCAWVQRGALAG
jgi:guanine nucleotide-binding protein G(i) subunit alpha